MAALKPLDGAATAGSTPTVQRRWRLMPIVGLLLFFVSALVTLAGWVFFFTGLARLAD
jgi:hypothetical protein